MYMRLTGLMTLAIAAGLACGPAGQPAPAGPEGAGAPAQPKSGGALTARVTTDPWDWDITYSKSNPNDDGIALAYDSLLQFKAGTDLDFNELIVQPGLAERWEVSPDSRKFTFHLRKGVKFQNVPPVNGRELNSSDIKFTLEYRTRTGEVQDKGLPPGEVAYMFQGLQQVETPDPHTVVVHFKDPFVPFLNYAASSWNPVLPKEIFQQDGHFREKIAGTGPFLLDQSGSQKGSRWVFKKNPDYWAGDRVYLNEIRWLVLPDEATSYAAFQTKQLDILETIPYADAQEVIRAAPDAPKYRYLLPVAGMMYFSMLPSRNSPLLNDRVRKALQLSIDRDELNKVSMGGEGAWGMPGSVHGLFTDTEVKQIQKQDLEEAKRLVAQSGYKGEAIEWPVPSDEDSVDISMMQLIQAQAKRAGLNIELKFLERADQRKKRRSGDFDIDGQMNPSLGLMHDDADSIVFGRLHSKSRQNYGKINDPQLDKTVEASRAESNPEKRRQLMRDAAKRVVENAYVVGLLHPPLYGFWQPYVKNYRPSLGHQSIHKYAWVDK